MADDVASLGFAIDSSQAVTAEVALKRLTATSQAMENAAKALEAAVGKLGSAHRKAADEANRATGFNKALEVSLAGIRNQMIAMAGGLGVVGAGLTALGPLGLAAAVGLKLVGDAIGGVRDVAERAGQGAASLINLSEGVKLTVNELRALKQISGSFGVSSEQLETWLQRAAPAIEHAREGTGALADALNVVSPTFLRAMENSRSMAGALDVLGQAAQSAKEQGKDVSLFWRDVFGRASQRADPVFAAVALAGGITEASTAFKEFGGTVEAEIERRGRLSIANTILQKQVEVLNSTLLRAGDVLEFENKLLESELLIKRKIVDATKSVNDAQDASIRKYQDERIAINELQEAEAARTAAAARTGGRRGLALSVLPSPSTARDMALQEGATPDAAITKTAAAVAILTDTIKDHLLPLKQAEALMTRWTTAMGAAVTIDETAKLTIDKLRVAYEANDLGTKGTTQATNDFNRALNAIQLGAVVAKESQRNSILGTMASVSAEVKQKQDEINLANIKGLGITSRQKDALLELTQERARGTLQIKAQIDSTNVEAATMFMSVGAAAEYTAKQTLLNEAIRNHKVLEDADKEAIGTKAKALGEAAAALDRMKVINDLSGTFASGFLTDLSHGTKAVDALRTSLTRLSDSLIDMATKQLVKAALGGLFAGASPAGGLFSLFGLGGVKVATGHTGGIVGSLTGSRYIHPEYFDNAPRFGRGGIVGGEVPIIAHVGERISTPAQWAAQGRGGGDVHVHITNNVDATGADAAAVQRLMVGLVEVNRSIEKRAVAALGRHRRLEG